MSIVRSEIEIMSSIKEEKTATIRRLVEITGFGHNYVRYLCRYLTGCGLLSKVAPRTYGLAPEGEKALQEVIPRPPSKVPLVEEKKPVAEKPPEKRPPRAPVKERLPKETAPVVEKSSEALPVKELPPG